MKTLKQKLKGAFVLIRFGLDLIASSPKISNQYAPLDVGVAEIVIDSKTREIIKRIRREANSDITIITEKGADGKMNSYTETLVRQRDGSYKVVRDVPQVWQFQTSKLKGRNIPIEYKKEDNSYKFEVEN